MKNQVHVMNPYFFFLKTAFCYLTENLLILGSILVFFSTCTVMYFFISDNSILWTQEWNIGHLKFLLFFINDRVHFFDLVCPLWIALINKYRYAYSLIKTFVEKSTFYDLTVSYSIVLMEYNSRMQWQVGFRMHREMWNYWTIFAVTRVFL